MTLQSIISCSETRPPAPSGIYTLGLACGHDMNYGGNPELMPDKIECAECKNDLVRKGLPTASVKRKRRAYRRPDFVKHGAMAKEMLPVGIL